ncbi:hypothetical protein [Gilliamella sp. ESL0250]|uniref:hypothetical protein n=1 Tax=Gilliamella sp. ESL0250 TaxID=2705036 RepID=UPI001580F1B1|nr:hypothetical protein [Gilliamella sp. ESL0250]NUF49539.1 hypothetical protein [Gilliamella sp. ESL0250]
MMALTEAQKRAEEKRKQKRLGRPRLPGIYLTDSEHALLTEMGEKYGSKKAAIFEGLHLLKDVSKDG